MLHIEGVKLVFDLDVGKLVSSFESFLRRDTRLRFEDEVRHCVVGSGPEKVPVESGDAWARVEEFASFCVHLDNDLTMLLLGAAPLQKRWLEEAEATCWRRARERLSTPVPHDSGSSPPHPPTTE